MARDKTEIIKNIEELIQYDTYKEQIGNELKNTLKIFYTTDKKSLIKYIDLLFDSDFEKSVYATIFIEFICSIPSDDILLLIENIFNKIKNKDLKKTIIENCPNTSNYKIKFFLYRVTENLVLSTDAKLSLLIMGDATFENDLLNEYEKKLKIGIFLSKYLESLSKSGSIRVWKITNEFIKKDNIDERDRYRILNHILKLNDRNSATTLIELYNYYKDHPELTVDDVVDIPPISINLGKQENKNFINELLKDIFKKLNQYSYISEIKNFIEKIKS